MPLDKDAEITGQMTAGLWQYPRLYFAEVNAEDLRIAHDDNKRKFRVATFELENVRYADEDVRSQHRWVKGKLHRAATL